jgi:hypothetical protein
VASVSGVVVTDDGVRPELEEPGANFSKLHLGRYLLINITNKTN